jgi:hypothetical protein
VWCRKADENQQEGNELFKPGSNGDTFVVTLSNACQKGQPADGTTLVFQRLGDSYFLYQVWTEGNTTGRELRMSKAQVQLAKNNSKPELVIVAANISH